ncbi:hypothetical protein [Paraburkholderia sp. BL10I2N1]|uniref:hypothetical protein n=1 Tax=Paraburkholderia sp. BL10I2N1 TaxID=1938796 RepID=UPI001AAC517B|nr:hypothetical protein [Paraburkholderia sp. BL10I2N1]
MVSIDLCQHCVKEALGAWLRIAPDGDEFELIRIVKERENQSTVRVELDDLDTDKP